MIKKTLIILTACCLIASVSRGDIWEDFAKYEYGAASDAGKKVEELLRETPVDEYGALEEKLLAVVSSPDATQTTRALACRFLQQVGTKKAIPAVAALLADKTLAHYARLVLERLRCDEADAALRDALATAPDNATIGILGSLGERGDRKAIAAAKTLAESSKTAVAAAAIRALGAIGGTDAAKALSALKTPDELVPARMQAMVACAGSFTGDEAAALCEQVLAGSYSPCKIAALRALAEADAAKAIPLISTAITGDDAMLRAGALGIVAGTEGEELTKAMIGLLDDLSGDRKVGLISALGSRGDTAAMDALTALVKGGDEAVRDAAVKAMSKMGDAGTVPVLLGLADSPDVGASVARAITGMSGDGIDAALIDALGQDALRAPAIKALAARGCTTAVPALLKLVQADDPAVRKEAWAGIATLGSGKDIEPIMKAVVEIDDESELPPAEAAIKKVASRADDTAACFEVIAGYYDRAKDATKGAILALGSISGDPSALAMERKALKSGNDELAGKALRALAAWPNGSAAEDLLAVAKSADTDTDRIVALRGYIRLAGLDSAGLSGEKRTAMFKTALQLATRDEEKKQIVSGLQNAVTAEALAMLDELMDNPALAAEAELSAANLAWNIRTSNPEAATAMAKKLKKSKNKTVAKTADKTLADLAKTKAYVRAWMISPIYDKGGDKALFKKKLPPETGGKDVTWKLLKKGIGQETIDLIKAAGNKSNCCVYLKTTLVAPKKQETRLEMGSDDAIKAWLNGKLVHENFQSRGCTPGQDKVTVTLNEGENSLMLKIVQGSGDWAASCRIRDKDGMPVDGLTVKPQ